MRRLVWTRHRQKAGLVAGLVLVLAGAAASAVPSAAASPAAAKTVGPVDDLPVPTPRPPVMPADPAGAHPNPSLAPPDPGSGAAAGAIRQPSVDPGCLDRLKVLALGTISVSIGPQPDPRCTVADAVKLTSLRLADGSTVAVPDAPTLACITAETFATYVSDLLEPLAKGSYGSALASISTGPGLECRARDHVPGAKLSAHGQGLAVDIAGLTLRDGRVVAVGAPKTAIDRAFEAAARAAGCGYFHTALGPGSDAFHETHWHFDLEPRGTKGDAKFCE